MKQATTSIRSGHKGDIVVISGHHVGEPERLGEILEVLGEADHVHFRVRWEDGSDSVFYPGSDASIRPTRRSRSTRRSP
jgi:rRNA processing protein Gar1